MIEKILAVSFIVQAIYYTMKPGEIFCQLGYFLKGLLKTKWHNPIFSCPVCMCPWYGSAVYWIFFHVSAIEWILIVLSATGLNAVINKLAPKK